MKHLFFFFFTLHAFIITFHDEKSCALCKTIKKKKKKSQTCSLGTAWSQSEHLVLVKDLEVGWGLGWKSYSHYPSQYEKSLLSVRGVQTCVSSPVFYSYQWCGQGIIRSEQEERAAGLGSVPCWSRLTASLHTAVRTHTHKYTQVFLAHLVPTGLALWGKMIPPTQTCSTTMKIFLNTMTLKTDMLVLTPWLMYTVYIFFKKINSFCFVVNTIFICKLEVRKAADKELEQKIW